MLIGFPVFQVGKLSITSTTNLRHKLRVQWYPIGDLTSIPAREREGIFYGITPDGDNNN